MKNYLKQLYVIFMMGIYGVALSSPILCFSQEKILNRKQFKEKSISGDLDFSYTKIQDNKKINKVYCNKPLANFKGADFSGCKFGTNISFPSFLEETNFSNCSVKSSNINGTNIFSNKNLKNADLSNLKSINQLELYSSQLEGAKLVNISVKPALTFPSNGISVSNAKFSKNTIIDHKTFGQIDKGTQNSATVYYEGKMMTYGAFKDKYKEDHPLKGNKNEISVDLTHFESTTIQGLDQTEMTKMSGFSDSSSETSCEIITKSEKVNEVPSVELLKENLNKVFSELVKNGLNKMNDSEITILNQLLKNNDSRTDRTALQMILEFNIK